MTKVLVAGCFDLLHPGHLRFLKEAKKHGDKLVVLLARDCNILVAKKRKPYFKELERKEILEELRLVDEVVLGNEDANRKYDKLLEIKPDVLVFGYDQTGMEAELKEFMAAHGLKIKIVELKEAFEPHRLKSTRIRGK